MMVLAAGQAMAGVALAQSLVATTHNTGTSSNVIIIDPTTGTTQPYMTIAVPVDRDAYFLAALPDCRLAATTYLETASNVTGQLMNIDTFTGTSTIMNLGAPLNTMREEGMDYSPRHGALLISFTTLGQFGTNRLALVNPQTGAVIATSSSFGSIDLDTIMSGPTSDVLFDLNNTSTPRVRQLSALFSQPRAVGSSDPAGGHLVV